MAIVFKATSCTMAGFAAASGTERSYVVDEQVESTITM